MVYAETLEDAEWREFGKVKEVTVSKDESGKEFISITTDQSTGFGLEAAPVRKVYPKLDLKGLAVALAGAAGMAFQGVRLGGRLIFFKTAAEMDADHKKWVDNWKLSRRKEYEKNIDGWRKDIAALSPALQKRIQRFIKKSGNEETFFIEDMGSYELFVMKESEKFVPYWTGILKKIDHTNIAEVQRVWREFMDLKCEEQKKLVPFDDGHSGNTFGGAARLGLALALGDEV